MLLLAHVHVVAIHRVTRSMHVTPHVPCHPACHMAYPLHHAYDGYHAMSCHVIPSHSIQSDP